MERGKHTITALKKDASSPTTGPAPRRSFWALALLALAVLLAALLSGCAKKEEASIEQLPPTSAGMNTPSYPEPPPSAPTKPQPPQAKLALIEAVAPPPNVEPISVVLGGGDYDITYETADSIPDLETLGKDRVFFANYDENTTSGNQKTADIYVLIGSLQIHVADISESDSLYASILARGKAVNAYFNFATSERGPPASKKNRRVIVVGDIQYVGLPARYGESTAEVNYLNLNPTDKNQEDYEAAMVKYEEDVKAHRVAMDGWKSEQALHNSPGKKSSIDPPAYHPPEYHQPTYRPPPPRPRP